MGESPPRRTCATAAPHAPVPEDSRRELRDYGALRRELITVERAALLRLRNDGTIGADVIRRVERDLDLDEARIRT